MTNIIENMDLYRPFGQPAFATAQFKTVPSSGVTITINGDVYTTGTEFSGATTPVRAAQGLTAAIRADVEYSYINATKQFIRPYSAKFYNDTVFIFATAPGSAGNAMTIATSDTSSVNLSGATFSGGTDATSSSSTSPTFGGTPIDAAALSITSGGTSQTVFAANASRRYLIIQNLSSDELWVNFGAAATQDKPSLALAPASGTTPGGSIEYAGSYIPTSTVTIIGTTTGSKFSAKQG